MSAKPLQVDFPDIQAAIYRVALSLDAFLISGIPYGLLQHAARGGFLQKTASNLLGDVAALEEEAQQAPARQPEVTPVLAALRAKCQQLIDVVTGLNSFTALSLQELRATVAQIPLLRGECVQVLQELEAYFRTPKPFYSSRPSHSTAAVNDFLANLERVFTQEWVAAQPVEGPSG
jgi:hypothetical protein